MTTPEKRRDYGGEALEVEGWILHFFGIYKKIDVNFLPDYTINVPVKVVDLWSKTEKELTIVSNWVSTSKLNERTYKPDMGLCIVEQSCSKYE